MKTLSVNGSETPCITSGIMIPINENRLWIAKSYQRLNTDTFCHLKMRRNLIFRKYFFVIAMFFGTFCGLENLSAVQASIANVDRNGAYNKLTVKITEQVPRQLCQQTLDNLEVRLYINVTFIIHINIFNRDNCIFYVLLLVLSQVYKQ